MNLKKREDLKGALTDKFKGRFGRGAKERGDDEVSVASTAIRREVSKFADQADVTEANLGRLERKLYHKASKRRESDAVSASGVSVYSTMSRSRSLASIGENIAGGGQGYDWNKLDEYASYLHEQDAIRQKQGVVALQRKLRADLDSQVAERRCKRQHEEEEGSRHHMNLMVELERWKETEQFRAEELRHKVMKEKDDRDEQLAFENRLKNDAENQKRKDESELVDKIVNEMEHDQVKYERKKTDHRKNMRKIFDDNMEDTRQREIGRKQQQETEAQAMRDYNRLLDDQDEQRAEELAARMERQKQLMAQMQANVAAQAKESGDNDAMRANAQQEEMDRHAYEAEKAKQARLKQMRLENKSYLFRQMDEKAGRSNEDKDLQDIQAKMLSRDTAEYNELERQKAMQRRHRNFEHRQEIERQIIARAGQSVPAMSEAEVAMNRQLLTLVDRTLEQRDVEYDDQYACEA